MSESLIFYNLRKGIVFYWNIFVRFFSEHSIVIYVEQSVSVLTLIFWTIIGKVFSCLSIITEIAFLLGKIRWGQSFKKKTGIF